MFRHIVRSSMVMLALGFAACDDVPTTVPVDDSEAVFDPTFDVTLPPDGGTCPEVFYEESKLLSNGVTVTWTTVLAGFDYAEGTGYIADVNWSVDQGSAAYVGFTTRNGPNTWTPKKDVDGLMTPGAAGDGTLPVTVSMTPMHEAGDDSDDDDDDGDDWAGKIGNGHFWLRLEIDNGEGRPKKVKLGVNFHLEDPADGFGTNCPGDGPPVDPPVGNQPPTADAGGDQTVTDTDDGGDESVTLDGSGSVDPDGTIATWVWTENASEIATGENPLVAFAVGTHDVTLTVTDDEGATDTDQVVITVEAAPTGNQPPTADAGADQTVTDTDDGGDESVTLDGSGSVDPDGTIASWVWTEGASEVATGETPTVAFAVGTHDVTLTVTDNEGATDSDLVVITVEAAPPAPISFAADIQPYFQAGQANCVMCHSGGGGQKGVNLDSHSNIMAGGDDGPLVVPFNSNASSALLVPQLESNHHNGPDDSGFVVILKQWIDAGALEN